MNEKIKRKALLNVSFSLDFLERGTFTEYPYLKLKQELKELKDLTENQKHNDSNGRIIHMKIKKKK